MNMDRKRAEIMSLINDIDQHKAYFKALGVDVSDPGDREAFDIVCRIQRRLASQTPKKKTA